jgi:hypothetical protein
MVDRTCGDVHHLLPEGTAKDRGICHPEHAKAD